MFTPPLGHVAQLCPKTILMVFLSIIIPVNNQSNSCTTYYVIKSKTCSVILVFSVIVRTLCIVLCSSSSWHAALSNVELELELLTLICYILFPIR